MDEMAHRLRLELRVSGDTLRGTVIDESGSQTEFSGRVGLLGAVDAHVLPPTQITHADSAAESRDANA